MLIDTHTHLYLDKFRDDLDEVMARARDHGVEMMLLPNIDNESIDDVFRLVGAYPGQCYPMVGLHPCSVKEDYLIELERLKKYLDQTDVIAIGEIGIDLYWDKSLAKEQIKAFRHQISWALDMDLPIVIHSRDAMRECIDIVEDMQDGHLRGVFHCFDQDEEKARKILDLGFYLGIGGVLTFKKNKLPDVVREVPLERIILETDAPYLTPAPYRGKRNESAYVRFVAEKLAEIKGIDLQEIEEITTANAKALFKL